MLTRSNVGLFFRPLSVLAWVCRSGIRKRLKSCENGSTGTFSLETQPGNRVPVRDIGGIGFTTVTLQSYLVF